MAEKSLLNVPNYFKTKTIKLSDNYVVFIKYTNSEGVALEEEWRCIGFTIPKVAEFDTDVYKYGNVAQTFIIPKTDLVQEVSIEIMESELDKGLKVENDFFSCLTAGGQNMGNGFNVERRYDINGYTTNTGTYNINGYDIDQMEIAILDNTMTRIVYRYIFTELKLANAETYDMNYEDDTITKYTLTFTFNQMIKGRPDRLGEDTEFTRK